MTAHTLKNLAVQARAPHKKHKHRDENGQRKASARPRLPGAVSDLTLDKLILQEASRGNF
jgi:hypothetical protein